MDKQFMLSTRILFCSVCMGPILFIGVVVLLQAGIDRPFIREGDPLLYTVIAVATASVTGSTLFYRLRLPAVKSLSDLTEKLAAWRTLFIIKLAILEGSILFSVVALLIQETDIYLYIAAALTGMQTLNFPLESSLLKELDIS